MCADAVPTSLCVPYSSVGSAEHVTVSVSVALRTWLTELEGTHIALLIQLPAEKKTTLSGCAG